MIEAGGNGLEVEDESAMVWVGVVTSTDWAHSAAHRGWMKYANLRSRPPKLPELYSRIRHNQVLYRSVEGIVQISCPLFDFRHYPL
jgi:hypothetical protein